METSPVRRKEILERPVGDECMLYDTLQKTVHVLNSTAEFLWRRCDGRHTLQQIANEAAEFFDVPIEKARSELEECLENLQRLSLLEKADASAGKS